MKDIKCNTLYIDKNNAEWSTLLLAAIDLLLKLDQRIEVHDEGFGIVLRFADDPFVNEMGQDRLMWVTSEEAEHIDDRRIENNSAETDFGTDI